MHIEQICPSNRSVDYLHWCHKKKGQSGQSSQSGQSQQKGPHGSRSQMQYNQNIQRAGQPWSSYQSTSQQQKCYKCGLTKQSPDTICPAQGQTCHKCGKTGHFMCGKVPFKFRSSGPPKHQNVNELNFQQQANQNQSQFQRSHNQAQMYLKQAVNMVDLANSVDVLSSTYIRQLELDAMTSVSKVLSTQSAYSNIQMNGVFVRRKQDTGAKLIPMPLNIYNQLKQKCNLEPRPCSDVNIVGYNKQSGEYRQGQCYMQTWKHSQKCNLLFDVN